MTTSAEYKPVGRLDGTTAAAHEKSIQELMVGEVNTITIDLSELEYVSSVGLRVLLMAAKAARAKGGSAMLKSPRPAVLQVLNMSGFDKIFQIQI